MIEGEKEEDLFVEQKKDLNENTQKETEAKEISGI